PVLPGSYRDITVQFAPATAAGTVSGSLLFDISDPKAPHQIVALTGSSLAGCLRGTLEPIDLGTVGFAASSNFYCASDWRTIRLWDLCEDKGINVTSLETAPGPSPFLIQGDPTPILVPGTCPIHQYCAPLFDSATFQVAYAPRHEGPAWGGIQVFTDELA